MANLPPDPHTYTNRDWSWLNAVLERKPVRPGGSTSRPVAIRNVTTPRASDLVNDQSYRFGSSVRPYGTGDVVNWLNQNYAGGRYTTKDPEVMPRIPSVLHNNRPLVIPGGARGPLVNVPLSGTPQGLANVPLHSPLRPLANTPLNHQLLTLITQHLQRGPTQMTTPLDPRAVAIMHALRA